MPTIIQGVKDPRWPQMIHYVLGITLSGVGATVCAIGWEGQHRYRLLILLLGGLLILAGVVCIFVNFRARDLILT